MSCQKIWYGYEISREMTQNNAQHHIYTTTHYFGCFAGDAVSGSNFF